MNDSRGHLDAEHYRRVLELGPSFGHDKLKAAYRRLILMWHPDRHPSDAEVQTLATEKAKQLNTAYEYLSELLDENGGEYRSPEKCTGSATRPFRSATRRSWQSTSARPKHTYRGSIYKTGFQIQQSRRSS